MKINPDELKLQTNICVHRLLTFGFPKEAIARELNIDPLRIDDVVAFYGEDSFPQPVTDRWEYFQRLMELLVNPASFIEDSVLEKKIDHVRAKMLVTVLELNKGHASDYKCINVFVKQIAEAPAFSRQHPEGHPSLMIAIAWVSKFPPNQP